MLNIAARAAEAPEPLSVAFVKLGLQCSTAAPVDLVSAHKWFNLAAMHGNEDAVRLRREVAAQMSDAEIGAAQRAARDYLRQHPEARVAAAPRLDAAA